MKHLLTKCSYETKLYIHILCILHLLTKHNLKKSKLIVWKRTKTLRVFLNSYECWHFRCFQTFCFEVVAKYVVVEKLPNILMQCTTYLAPNVLLLVVRVIKKSLKYCPSDSSLYVLENTQYFKIRSVNLSFCFQ